MTAAPLFTDVADAPDGGQARWLLTADGVQIRVGYWGGGEKGTILLFPGRTEYIEKYGRAAGELLKRGYSTVAIDWRGQGLADRLLDHRGIGHVGDFEDYQVDIRTVLNALPDMGLPEPLFLIGHSMGGCIGLRALYEGLPVKAAVFSAPMWGIQMSSALRPVAWTLSSLARVLGFGSKLAPGTNADNYTEVEPFDDNMLTTNRDMFDYMQAQTLAHPELGLGGPSLHWLNEALRETRGLAARPAPSTPCLTFLGMNERIVDAERIKDRMQGWTNGTLEIVPKCEHELMMETSEIQKQFFDGTTQLFDRHL
jgi:lysophospholipase